MSFISAKAAWKEAIAAAQSGLLTRRLLVGLVGSCVCYAAERQPELLVLRDPSPRARALVAALVAAVEPGCVQLVETHLSAGGERFSWPVALDEIILEAREQAAELSAERLLKPSSLEPSQYIIDRLSSPRRTAPELYQPEPDDDDVEVNVSGSGS